MSVDTQWATKREVEQDREKVDALTAQVARLEVQIGATVREGDKHGATKADVSAVLLEVERVRAAVETTKGEVRSDVQSVRTELADVKSDIRWIKWFLGAGISLGTGVLLLLLRMAGLL